MGLAKNIFSGIVVEGHVNHLAIKFSMKAVVAPHIPRKVCKCSQKDVMFFRDVLMTNAIILHLIFSYFRTHFFLFLKNRERQRNIIFIYMRQLVARDSTEDVILLKLTWLSYAMTT